MTFATDFFGPKTLGPDYWRYRLLHWAFGVKDVANTSLPRFLYTHFCPLFWMTNALVLLAPFIMGFKLLTLAVKVVFSILCDVIAKIPSVPINQLGLEQALLRKAVTKYYYDVDSFNRFWSRYETEFNVLSKDAALEYFTNYFNSVTEATERAKLIKEKRDARIAAFCIYSQKFFQTLALCLIGVIIGTVLYGVYLAIPTVWFGCVWVVSHTFTIFKFLCVAFVLVLTTVGITTKYENQIITFFENLSTGLTSEVKERSMVLKGLSKVFQFIGAVLDGTWHFVNTMYSNHCPPITFVTNEDSNNCTEASATA